MASFTKVCKGLPFKSFPSVHQLNVMRHQITSNQDEVSNLQNSFIVLYKWPTMKHFRILSRLKIFQAGIMTVSVPPLSYWYSIGAVSGDSLLLGCSAAIGTVLILCCLSYSFSRVLGELSYCTNTQTVRLSHLNFFGQRCNVNMQLTDIVPYSDTQSALHTTSLVHRLETNVTKGAYFYSLKYGQVINREQLRFVLGLD